jgi:hypothetical protein
MTRQAKVGTGIGIALGMLALVTAVLKGIVWAGDSRYTTHEVVDSKITLAVNSVTRRIDGHRMSGIEDAIREMEIRIAVGEATKADYAQLEYYKRQREELLASNPMR